MKPVAYEGAEPYIFVSYAHRDSEQVFEVLNELDRRGYRLWYDDGIAPGSEWPEDIAQHLDGAALVLAFITNNSMASRNCRREINFSLSREKPFLSVVLEPTEMPLGMEMQLSAQQSIVRYNYDSWDAFIGKILLCPDLKSCERPQGEASKAKLQAVAMEPQVAPVEPQAAAIGPQVAAIEPQAEPMPSLPAQEIEAEVTMVTSDKSYGTQDAERGGHKRLSAKTPSADTTSTSTKLAKGKKLVLLVAAVAVLLCGVLLAMHLLGGKKPTELSWGGKIEADDTAVYALGKTVTAADLEAIGSHESLHTLTLADCDLSACDFAAIVAQGGLGELQKIDLSGATGIDDYSFLADMPLSSIDLSGCVNFNDLTLLDTSKLSLLDVSGTGVSDLTPIAEASLLSLSFADTAVESIEPLVGMDKLDILNGARTQVSDLTPLAGLESLDSIDFSGCKLAKLPASLSALSLEKAYLADTGISQVKMLGDCTRLTELNLSGNPQLKDLSPVNEQNYGTLTYLDLGQTGVSGDGLAWVSQCANLVDLHLDGIALSDLALCEGLGNLKRLSAVGCGIGDIAALSSCQKLEEAILACNKITDASPLSSMSLSHDTIVELSFNELTSVDGLAEGAYRALMLYGNDESIAATVPPEIDSYITVVPWFEGMTDDPKAGDYRGRIFLVDCPKNQQLKTKDALKGCSLTFITADELVELYATNGFGYSLKADYSYFLELMRGEAQPVFTATWS